MKTLDFIVIGAQKSATTSLFRYLQQHPEINMPADKEAPFFSEDRFYSLGWEDFARTRFDPSTSGQFWGTVSPQYMSDQRVPARIAQHMPNTRLIALLRNPVDRAYSHYRMAVRRGTENRSFPEAVDDLRSIHHQHFDLAAPDAQIENGIKNCEEEYYLAWGEYGRVLELYRRYFENDRILVLYMNDLKNNPDETVRTALEFIGADSQIIPANVGKVYHTGGTKRIIPETWKHFLRDQDWFRSLWHLVPEQTRGNINYWYEQLNVRKQLPDTIDPGTRLKLVDYFSSDVELLQNVCSRRVPWKEFSGVATS